MLADGSAHLSINGDLGAEGRVVQVHVKATGGAGGGFASTKILGCAGGGILGCGIPPGRGKRFVYIIDKSGSMRGDNRLAVAKQALIEELEKLSSDKKIFVYFFNSRFQAMPASDLLPATTSNINRIASWIRSKRARGGTNPRGAIANAFDTKNPDTIWILTDGRFGGRTVLQPIERLNPDKAVRINTIGFARSESQIDRSLRAIAENNGGEYRFYNSLETR